MTTPIDQLSLKEIVELVSAWDDSNRPGGELLRLYQRLMDIAFMDHGVSEPESRAAAGLAETIRKALLGGCGSTELRMKSEEAMDYHKNHLDRFGRGTVIWEQEEVEFARKPSEGNISQALQDHLDRTSDTIGALGFSVNYYVAEILKLAMQKRIASPEEVGALFDRLTEIMEDEPNAVFKEKVESMARMIRKIVLP